MRGLIASVLGALALLSSGLASAATGGLVPHAPAPNYVALDPATAGYGAVPWTTHAPDPLNSWNIQQSAVNPGWWRFEARQGDEWSSDSGRNPKRARVEFNESARKVSYGPTFWLAFSQRITCQTLTSGRQVVMGQVHTTDPGGSGTADPILEWRYTSRNRLRVLFSGSVNADRSGIVQTTAYDNTSYQCGQWYDFIAKMTFTVDATSLFELKVRAPGATSFTTVYSQTGQNLGYLTDGAPYWKYGIYSYDDPETLVVEYANLVSMTSTDLSFLAARSWAHPQ